MMRSRKWFITINENAECWYKYDDIIKDLTRCKYAYIVHDKDDNLHCHIVLNFENARSFECLFNTFVGAHIEECQYFYKSIRYLIHLDDEDKIKYDIDDIVTNYSNVELSQFMCLNEFEYLSTETLLIAIDGGSVRSITDAVRVWGINQVNVKRGLIDTLLKEKGVYLITDERLKQLEHENIMLKSELNIYKVLYGDLEKGEYKSE